MGIKGWIGLMEDLEEKVNEEINQKRVIKYSAKDSKHYKGSYLKEKNDIESEQYEFTHTRKGVEHKIKLYRLN